MKNQLENCRQNNDFFDMADAIKKYLIDSPQFEAGSKIVEADIASHFRCSRAPVREALKYLASMGIVELIPNRGAFVVELSPKEIQEIFDLRVLIEGSLIEQLILDDMLQAPDFTFLEECTQAMVDAATDQTDKGRSIQIIVKNDMQFHGHLWGIAGKKFYASALEAIHSKLTLAMYKDYYMRTDHLLEDVSMHFELIRYLRKGHVSMALKALKEHVGIYYSTL